MALELLTMSNYFQNITQSIQPCVEMGTNCFSTLAWLGEGGTLQLVGGTAHRGGGEWKIQRPWNTGAGTTLNRRHWTTEALFVPISSHE